MTTDLPASLEQLRKMVSDFKGALRVCEQMGTVPTSGHSVLTNDLRGMEADVEWVITLWRVKLEDWGKEKDNAG